MQPFLETDDSLFLARALHLPNSINVDGAQEFFVEKIVDGRRRGQGKHYLVLWRGEGPEGDIWLDAGELEDCEALDVWLAQRTGHASRTDEDKSRLTITIPPRTRSFLEGGRV